MFSIKSIHKTLNYCFTTGSSLINNYKILGVQKSASCSQIKKKYYQLAKIYHPDVCKQQNSHQKFSEITKAYQQLMQKSPSQTEERQSSFHRASHNPYQSTSQKRTKTHFEQDWQEYQTYDSFFKSRPKYKRPKKGQDVYVNLVITLRESFQGGMQKVKFTRKHVCESCEEDQMEICIGCGGKGEVFNRKTKQKVRCDNCHGQGFELDCDKCHGTRTVSKDVEEQVYVEKATHDKSILRVRNNGHQGYKNSNGDLYVTVLIQQSQKMRVDGNNIHSEIQIEYITAVFGGEIQIQTVQGFKKVKIPAGIQSGQQMRLFNYGIKSAFSTRIGDQILKFKIKVPRKLSNYQKKLMAQLSLEQFA